ncbi:hypothetical protein BDDG_11541 [Blastomyces dermatitidis ATCC 18188]|uniref:Uncharacterized protein n=1 Tax=Ajellomyces dermatitidis (strain ATCC 18188 / CBS 674.68) TaxID=653446 RepID=A0A0J9EJ50_AJEDA|nr:hypothetical protein BDDG_11541 [Blastomyces dermatitidis ATCC 18188]
MSCDQSRSTVHQNSSSEPSLPSNDESEYFQKWSQQNLIESWVENQHWPKVFFWNYAGRQFADRTQTNQSQPRRAHSVQQVTLIAVWITSIFLRIRTFSSTTTPTALLARAPVIASVCLRTTLCCQKIHGSVQ